MRGHSGLTRGWSSSRTCRQVTPQRVQNSKSVSRHRKSANESDFLRHSLTATSALRCIRADRDWPREPRLEGLLSTVAWPGDSRKILVWPRPTEPNFGNCAVRNDDIPLKRYFRTRADKG